MPKPDRTPAADHDGHSKAAKKARGGVSLAKIEGVEKRAQGYYAVKDVPRPLQAAVGKRRLVRSLKTRDPLVAKARRHAVLDQFEKIIAEASAGSSWAPEVEAGLAWKERWDAFRNGDPALMNRAHKDDPNPDWTPGDSRSPAERWLDDEFSLEEEVIAERLGVEAAETFRGLGSVRISVFTAADLLSSPVLPR